MKTTSIQPWTQQRCLPLIPCFAFMVAFMMLVSNPTNAAPPTPAQKAQAKAELHSYYAWANSPWTDDDQPYQNIRTSVDQTVASGKSLDNLLKQYQAALAKSLNDHGLQFGYFYTAYQIARDPNRSEREQTAVGLDILGNLSTILIKSPHPRTYNYARLAYLCGQFNFNDKQMRALGLRLVRRDPKDYDAKYYTVILLEQSPLPADQALALKYANALVASQPKKASAYAVVGYIHYESWLRTKNKQDAAEAVSQYQQYLELAPAKAHFRQQAETLIEQMQTG